MNNWGPLLLAVIISAVLICAVVFTNYPEAWFVHNMECTGAIGGGCTCTEESTSFICNK